MKGLDWRRLSAKVNTDTYLSINEIYWFYSPTYGQSKRPLSRKMIVVRDIKSRPHTHTHTYMRNRRYKGPKFISECVFSSLPLSTRFYGRSRDKNIFGGCIIRPLSKKFDVGAFIF